MMHMLFRAYTSTYISVAFAQIGPYFDIAKHKILKFGLNNQMNIDIKINMLRKSLCFVIRFQTLTLI